MLVRFELEKEFGKNIDYSVSLRKGYCSSELTLELMGKSKVVKMYSDDENYQQILNLNKFLNMELLEDWEEEALSNWIVNLFKDNFKKS